MPEGEQPEERELREEAPAYYERYQQAREDYLAAELRRLEEAISHSADRIQDFRSVMEQRFQDVDRRFVEQRTYIDRRFDEVDRRFNDVERQMDRRFSDIKEHIEKSDRWTRIFYATTLGFLVTILALLVRLLIA